MSVRLQREMALLDARSREAGVEPVDRAIAALTLHQRSHEAGCLCGWRVLGMSFARHQAEVLQELGLL